MKIKEQVKELGVVIMDNSLFEIDNMCHALETSLLLVENTKKAGKS